MLRWQHQKDFASRVLPEQVQREGTGHGSLAPATAKLSEDHQRDAFDALPAGSGVILDGRLLDLTKGVASSEDVRGDVDSKLYLGGGACRLHLLELELEAGHAVDLVGERDQVRVR
ncbi:MAG: hypothetical protein VXZ35_09545 [Pseudomonadota bacterium]|nr:hypothetical protein [Pseudomonadota bacterium]